MKLAGPGVNQPDVGGAKTRAALDMVIQSLQKSIGPKAAFSSISDVQRQAQLAALNTDPIEQRILEVMQQSLAELQKIVNGMNAKEVPPVFDAVGGGRQRVINVAKS